MAQLVRALHRYRRGHGFDSRSGLNFFQALFLNCLSWVYTVMIFICLKCIFRSTNIWLSCILITLMIMFCKGLPFSLMISACGDQLLTLLCIFTAIITLAIFYSNLLIKQFFYFLTQEYWFNPNEIQGIPTYSWSRIRPVELNPPC